MSTERVVGIDLGTATTEAAIYENGSVKMIRNPEGQVITPSVVGLDEEGEVTVGEKARAFYLIHPERTVIEVKRKIGSGEKVKLGGRA